MTRPVAGSAHTFTVSLFSATTGAILSNPTLATGDVKISTDGGALANITTMPTVNPAASGIVEVALSIAEVGTDYWSIHFVDAAGAEWKTLIYHDQNDNPSTATATVYPVQASEGARVIESVIKSGLNDTSPITVTVTDSNGDAVSQVGKTLKIVIEDRETGTDVEVIENASITKTATGFSFSPSATTVDTVGDKWLWACYDTANGNASSGSGTFIVENRAFED